PLGQADQGAPHSSEQADRRADRTAPTREEVRNRKDGAFCLEGPLRRRLSAEEGRSGAELGPKRNHQDLVATLDHHAAVRRPDLRRLQRPEVPAGAGDREHGGSQVRRLLADSDLLRPCGRQEGEAEISGWASPRESEAWTRTRLLLSAGCCGPAPGS